MEPPSEQPTTCNTTHCKVLDHLEALKRTNPLDCYVNIPTAAYGYLDPHSGKQIGSYMTYVITLSDYSVRRRYSDFEYLHAHLSRAYPFSIIPPIPSKQSLNSSISAIFGKGQNESSLLVSQRVRFFKAFLQHLLCNNVLFRDHVLHCFLTNPDASWKTEATKIHPTELKVIHDKQHPNTPNSKPFGKVLQVLDSINDTCTTLEFAQKSVLRRQQEILSSLESLGTAYNSFSLEYAELSNVLDALGEIHDINASSFREVVLNQQIVCDKIHEISQFIIAIRRAIKNYFARLVQWEVVSENLAKLRSDTLQQRHNTGEGEDQNIQKLDSAVRELTTEVDLIQTRLWDELGTWMDRINQMWVSVLTDVCNSQKTFSTKGISIWQQRVDRE